MSNQRAIDRRGFLSGFFKGSALFAAAAGVAALPASAQDARAQGQTAAPSDEKKAPDESKKDVPADQTPDEKKKSALVDKNGREYRVCDMCGGNMYLEERRWTCDQCGFSYEV